MTNKILVDASHPEETRVVVVRQNRVEEFDFESASKKQLRGNIYLAKVVRVEPSLQAAFVDYGGNRHGFLAFSEIHPDYYQIPMADRLALLEEEARYHRAEEEEEELKPRRTRRYQAKQRAPDADTALTSADVSQEGGGEEPVAHAMAGESERAPASQNQDIADTPHTPVLHFQPDLEEANTEVEPFSFRILPPPSLEPQAKLEQEGGQEDAPSFSFQLKTSPVSEMDGKEEEFEEEQVEHVGGGDAFDEESRTSRARRLYKIQEVIKRRQVVLVQVVKEERGNKGAALTTYLSLAGRYSVLMPNTARGGGISRKITDSEDRKRLKSIVQELEVPEGMGIILRTAGASRTRLEVRRDFEYLLRMWESIREVTLRSIAPMLIYEEGSLIKRTIRDLYNKDMEEVVVAGESGYQEALAFMQMLLPSHTKSILPYRESQPLFVRYGVEDQLDAMFSTRVSLKSGGYLIINQTEALVAIDVNSGRSTREHNIEDTAYRTNLEAAEEIARQLRLRDLAGLIVVDFIDMEENRNNRAVERRLKDALKNDRARIQVGRISHFGLLEMSRQRMRSGLFEGSTVICPQCQGSGHIRSCASIALHVLRAIEESLMKNNSFNLLVRTKTDVALYILNQKRSHIRALEERFGVTLMVLADEGISGAIHHVIERGESATPPLTEHRPDLVRIDSILPGEYTEGEEEVPVPTLAEKAEGQEGEPKRKKRRRKRTRSSGGDNKEEAEPSFQMHEPSEATEDLQVDSGNVSQKGTRGPRRGGNMRRAGKEAHTEFVQEASLQETKSDVAPENSPISPEIFVEPVGEKASFSLELKEASPPSHKRTGWWQRAKATFGGGSE